MLDALCSHLRASAQGTLEAPSEIQRIVDDRRLSNHVAVGNREGTSNWGSMSMSLEWDRIRERIPLPGGKVGSIAFRVNTLRLYQVGFLGRSKRFALISSIIIWNQQGKDGSSPSPASELEVCSEFSV